MYYRILVFLLFILESCVHPYDKEPNNHFQQVHIAYKTPISLDGSFQSFQDIDYYAIQIKNNYYYSIFINNIKGLNPMITLWDKNHHMIIRSDDYYKNFGEQIPSIFLKKGIYYISIQLNKNEDNQSNYLKNNKYHLTVTPVKKSIIQNNRYLEKEPNSSFKELQLLPSNSSMLGYYFPSKHPTVQDQASRLLTQYLSKVTEKNLLGMDLDLYLFKPQSHNDELASIKVSKVSGFDPVIAVFDSLFIKSLYSKAQNELILVQDNNSFGYGEAISHFPILKNHLYIIAVTTQSNFYYKPFATRKNQFYKLSLNVNSDILYSEKEPNNSISQATLIQQSKIKGSTDSYKENDFYLIKSNPNIKPSILDIQIKSNIANNNIVADIYNKSGFILASIENQNNQIHIPNYLFQEDFYINIHFTHNKKYKSSWTGSIPYTILLKKKEVLENKIVFNHEAESFLDNIFEYKNDITNHISHNLQGYINYPKDIDHFVFESKKSQKYSIRFQPHMNAPFVMKIYNYQQKLINKCLINNNFKDFFYSIFLAKKQKIIISIETLNNRYYNTSKPYILTIK